MHKMHCTVALHTFYLSARKGVNIMFWNLIAKIVFGVLEDFLVKLIINACSTLWENHRRSQQVRFA
jgi:hypothetical protein